MNEGRKHTAPTLFELACRNIKMHNIPYTEKDFTPRIINYLNMARKCPNPNCCGVYFDDKYVQVKFVDTCGAYRLPLLQYLCSPNCFEPSDPATSSFSSSSANNSDAGSESEEVVSVVPGSSSRLVPNTLNEVTDLSRRVIIGGHGVTTEELVNGDFRSRV